jgi:hypothetical protein
MKTPAAMQTSPIWEYLAAVLRRRKPTGVSSRAGPAALRQQPKSFVEGKGLTSNGLQLTERRCFPALWTTSLFHEYVGRGVRLRMEFAFVVASSPEDAPLRVDA